MADNEGGFDGEPLAGGRFSQMLFSEDVVGLEMECCFDYASSFSNSNPPKMLCFGGDYKNERDLGVAETSRTAQKSGLTCSDSSSASSTNNTNANSLSKANKKRNDSGNEPVQSLSAGAGAPAGSVRNCKKNKSGNSTLTGHAKVKKDQKLGERITTLQQLVSPFGKTDTASVLHEAMGYIRFLQDQVQVLCSPYLQRLSSSPHLQEGGENGKDLKSRGLCLVPLECTVHLANNNGADFWSPAMADAASNH